MQVDWFTLIAQIINFLVLVWLLKQLLYGRIIQAMNDREAKIAGRLEEAAQSRADAEREANLFQTRNREFEEQRDARLAQVEEEAATLRRQLMETVKQETETAREKGLEALQRERQDLLQEVRTHLGQQVFAFSRRALKELANTELEEQILNVFMERLQSLAPAERDSLIAAVQGSDGEVDFRTALPVPPEVRESLGQSLRSQLDERINVRFTTVPDLLCGVELRVDSHRLVWNLDSYLEDLEARVFEVLDARAQTDYR